MAQSERDADLRRESLRVVSQAPMETEPRLRGYRALPELQVSLKQDLTQGEEVLVR